MLPVVARNNSKYFFFVTGNLIYCWCCLPPVSKQQFETMEIEALTPAAHISFSLQYDQKALQEVLPSSPHKGISRSADAACQEEAGCFFCWAGTPGVKKVSPAWTELLSAWCLFKVTRYSLHAHPSSVIHTNNRLFSAWKQNELARARGLFQRERERWEEEDVLQRARFGCVYSSSVVTT